MYLVRKGQIRPNTPVAWSYAKDDGYTFAPAVYADYAQGLIPKLTNQIVNAQESTGYQAPPSFQVCNTKFCHTKYCTAVKKYGFKTLLGQMVLSSISKSRYRTQSSIRMQEHIK